MRDNTPLLPASDSKPVNMQRVLSGFLIFTLAFVLASRKKDPHVTDVVLEESCARISRNAWF